MSVSIVIVGAELSARKIVDRIAQCHPRFVIKGRTNCPENALRLIRRYRPDVLLLSFGLPDHRAMETVRAAKRYPSMRVVTVGFQGRFGDAVSSIEAGADAHLFANSSPDDAIRVLETATAGGPNGQPSA